jgi:peptide deformylase
MQLLVEPSPTLRIRCRDDFVVTMRDVTQMFGIVQDKKALGLAAPQVGIDARYFVTYWQGIFVNPRISQVDV